MRVNIKNVNTAKNLLVSLGNFQAEASECYHQFARDYDDSINRITEIHNSITSDFEGASQELEQASQDYSSAMASLSSCQAEECDVTSENEEGETITTHYVPDCSSEESDVSQASSAYDAARESYNKAKCRYDASSEVYSRLGNVSGNMEYVQDSYKSLLNSTPISYERLKFAVDVFDRALAVEFPNQTSSIDHNKYLKARFSNEFLNFSSKEKGQNKGPIIDVEIKSEQSLKNSQAAIVSSYLKGNIFEKEFLTWCKTNNILCRIRTMSTYINENYNPNDEYDEEVIDTEQKNVLDFYLKDINSIWEVKSGYENSKIELKQMETYRQLLELGYFYRDKKDDSTKYVLEEVNYLFKSKEGLLNNIDHLRGTGIALWYMDETDTPQIYND